MLNSIYDGMAMDMKPNHEEILWLIEQAEKVKEYEKALKFYANKENYEVWSGELDPEVSHIHNVDHDEGRSARLALGMNEGGEFK